MKKLLILFLFLACSLMLSCACAAYAEAGSSDLLIFSENDDLVILNSNVILTTEDYSNFISCYIFAEIRNSGTSDAPITGSVEALDANGNVVGEQTYISPSPQCIAPGRVSYYSDFCLFPKSDEVKDVKDIAQVRLTVKKNSNSSNTPPSTFALATAELATAADLFGDPKPVIRVTVTNDSGNELMNPAIAVAAYDKNGAMIYVANETFGLTSIHIPAGSSLVVDLEPYYDVKTWCDANNVAIDALRCIVYSQQ